MKQGPLWIILSLTITCLVSAFALSQIYIITKPKIDYQRQVVALKSAFGTVLPDADRFEPATPDSAVWFAFQGEERIGTILRVAKPGYAGPVPVTAAIDPAGRIIAIRVAGAAEGVKETPGLGLKATEPAFCEQFKGKTAAEIRLKKNGGTIEAITGATITSRAVTEALFEGMEKYSSLIVRDNDER